MGRARDEVPESEHELTARTGNTRSTRPTIRLPPVSRSIIAVLLSYLIFAISAAALFAMRGRDPHFVPSIGVAIYSIAYGMAFACASGYCAALIARRRPIAHASAVAAIMALVAVISLVVQREGSHWSQFATLVVMVPSAVGGGWLKASGVGSAPLAFTSNSDKRRGPDSA